ncbi:hypothetical protein SIID45300_01823 [Candidatus Magnetaquicoccaceae bacterium FCR-1]|uniref:Uncharacterized protein n=1 Tax=Candidatus Magnetaquiglobus chichijimensis TaxID=3141448 RepID=A0ABQ0C9C7_9PROT
MTIKSKSSCRRVVTGCLLSAALLVTGCSLSPRQLTLPELEKQRQSDLASMFRPADPIGHPITLSEVVARALRHNLDHQVKVMEEAQALDLTSLDTFELLPKVAANAATTARSNVSASNSRSVTTGQQSLEMSTSQDRHHTTADLGLTWNILDFGVSYYNARQNADRWLIARERERKVIQNLVQEARSAYWRAVAAQQLEPRIQAVVKLAESALADARRAEASGLRSPVESLQYRKSLLENLRQLESLQQEMGTAQVELATMMTLPPGTKYTLAVPEGVLNLPVWSLPLDKMEELAMLNQADVREMSYQTRIVADESRKTLLKLFPGISLSASKQRDDNSFSMNKDWYDAGLRVTWNLLGLLSAPAQQAYAKSNEEVVEMKRLALRMALLSQVHVAHRQFEQASIQFKRTDELYHVEKSLARHMENRVGQEAANPLDRIASATSAILAELRRYQSLSQAHNAFGRMMATTGQDPAVGSIREGSLEDLTGRVDRWLTGQTSAPTTAAKPAESKPAESKPAESKPAESKPAESKPAESKPAESKPAESKPAESKPAESKPVESKPAESKPAESKPAESRPAKESSVVKQATVKMASNVRSGPGMKFRTVRLLAKGENVSVFEQNKGTGWARIGENAWVAISRIAMEP